MRRIIVEAEVSADGVLGGDNPEFWQRVFPLHSADVTEYLHGLLFAHDALLMGRKTYTGFAQIWPTRSGKDAERINSMPKYVASSTLHDPLQWNATLLKGDVGDEIAKLKRQPGQNLLQYGIGELTRTMLKHGLVDEFRLMVNPFVVGQGPRMFEQMGGHSLKLVETKTFSSGVVLLAYQTSSAGA